MTGMIHRSLEKAALKGSGSGAKKSASPMQSEAKQMFSASSRPRLPLIISNDAHHHPDRLGQRGEGGERGEYFLAHVFFPDGSELPVVVPADNGSVMTHFIYIE